MMNKVEPNCVYNGPWIMCDAYLLAAMFFPETAISESRTAHSTIELNGKYTRGQMILNHLPKMQDNVKLIDTLSIEGIKKNLQWSVQV